MKLSYRYLTTFYLTEPSAFLNLKAGATEIFYPLTNFGAHTSLSLADICPKTIQIGRNWRLISTSGCGLT